MDAVVKEEEDGIDVSIDVKKEVKIEEEDEYQNTIPYEIEPKVELIDEMDVKKEEIDDNEYQHIIPYEYRDYMQQNIEELSQCGEERSTKTSKQLGNQCQKCHKYIVVKSFGHAQNHAVSHTNLKRYKCDQCSYGSWHRSNVQKHINSQHKNESCLVKEVQLSEESQLELRKLARECFPGWAKATRKIITINGKRFNSDDTPFVEKPADDKSRNVANKCQKCNKFIAVSCFRHAEVHAASHTSLKRFECELCNLKAFNRATVKRHVNFGHQNKSCLIKEIQLSKEEQLELKKITNECFPEVAKVFKRKTTVDEESVKVEEEHSTISRKRQRTSDAD